MGQSWESVSAATNVIDPLHSLAFSVQSNPGVYAVLIGSGISKAAGIPTGWDVTLDLVRKLAAVRNETPDPDPASWFRDTFGTEPNYSDLLDQLAKTQPERQQLLRGYWEPTEEEREEGTKEPTAAHHAIAALASSGFIRVIVTTNFDKLMERALSAAGVEPTVLSTADQIDGAPALVHTQHLVFKVHGDYLDTRILNTEKELAAYPPAVDALLDRIFDEYGLIVCGWSGDWDPALRAALERASSRRYTTYWTTRSPPKPVAQRLIAHRRAEVMQIEDANTFFEKVTEDVTAIEEFSKPHPVSVDVAVTKLKRYLAEPRHRIRLSDLIEETVEEVVRNTSGDEFSPADPKLEPDSIARRMRAYEAACTKLTAMALVGGTWAEREHYSVWHRALERLSSMKVIFGVRTYDVWRGLERYPGTLLLYALGLGAVSRNRLEFVQSLLSVRCRSEGNEEVPAAAILAPCVLLPWSGEKELGDLGRSRTPLNRWVEECLREQVRKAFPDEAKFVETFDKLEILLGLGSLGTVTGLTGAWSPIGCFYWRGKTRDPFLEEIRQSLEEEQAESPFIQSEILGRTPEEGTTRLDALENRIEAKGWDLHFIHMRRRRA